MPWHQFGLPCLIIFGVWNWGQVVLEPEQHPKNIHVRTSDDLRAPVESWVSLHTTFDLDGVEVTCACAHVWHLSLS